MGHYVPPTTPEDSRRKRYFSQFDDAMLTNLALALRLNANEYRLLFLLAAMANSENIVLVSTSRIAEIMDIERTNFQRLVKQLEEKGLVAKVPGEGRVIYRMLNPDIVMKCGPSMGRKVYARWDKEMESERNAVTRSGLAWLKDNIMNPQEIGELLASAKKVTHPKRQDAV